MWETNKQTDYIGPVFGTYAYKYLLWLPKYNKLTTREVANWFNDHTLNCCNTYTLLSTMGKKMW